jgi:hypothetical protein
MEMLTVEGMATLDTKDRNKMLAVLGAHVSVLHATRHTIFAEGRMGSSITDTVTIVWIWFFAQQVFSKIVLIEMNDHYITFDKEKLM